MGCHWVLGGNLQPGNDLEKEGRVPTHWYSFVVDLSQMTHVYVVMTSYLYV